MDLLNSLVQQLGISRDSAWIIQVFAIVFLTLLLSFFSRRMLTHLKNKLSITNNKWDDLLIQASTRPIGLLIWLIGILFAAEVVQHHRPAVVFSAIDPIRHIGVVVILIYFILQLIKGGEQILISKQAASEDEASLDEHTVHAIGKLLRISVFITGGLILLQTLGYSISGILAFGGVGGIAIGFAAKDLLANFFGGLMIYLDRPFKVGDWVRSSEKEIEGTVEHIGWRLTRIRTFDKRPLYVPNSIFTNITVENPSRMTNRRIKETIGIRYDDVHKMSTIVEQVRTMLREHPEIDTNQTLIVNFNAFASSSLDFFIYTFTRTTEWVRYHEIKQDVLLRIIEIIESNGAEVAFPTSTLHVQSLPEIEETH